MANRWHSTIWWSRQSWHQGRAGSTCSQQEHHQTTNCSSPAGNEKELQKELAQVRKGICNFPALVTSHPTKSMCDLNLQEYEIASPEPLHDFKGHMQNLVGEIRQTTTGEVKQQVELIYKSALDKDTVRCVHFRKAGILLCNAFASLCHGSDLHVLLHSAVEVCDIMYSCESLRNQKRVLRLHNLTFQHTTLCIQILSLCQNRKCLEAIFILSLVMQQPTGLSLWDHSIVNCKRGSLTLVMTLQRQPQTDKLKA